MSNPVVMRDDFDGPAGQLLTARDPNWTPWPNVSGVLELTGDGYLTRDPASGTTGECLYNVQGDLAIRAGFWVESILESGSFTLRLRHDPDLPSFYMLKYSITGAVSLIRQDDTGVLVELWTYQDPDHAVGYRGEYELSALNEPNGDVTLRVKRSGVLMTTYTDSSALRRQVGVPSVTLWMSEPDAGINIDWVEIEDISVGLLSAPAPSRIGLGLTVGL